MAQAARLSMRMQKELKLLLSDPPHGVSFPHLSSAASGSSDFSSFSTIDAQVKGPEDTVYANGIFIVKIQIPERYPFQPPIVAFATPIYHPNIDNSGRICLDILNLPPKGAWQPSLNISTVLTSIGLLLSEPNPDDGLMCEVSREYKYNRQTFDYKARDMTDKFAKVKAADGSGSSNVINFQIPKCENHGEDDKVIVNCDTVANGLPNDGNGKRKAVSSDGMITSRKKISLALPCQSLKKEEEFTIGVSDACKENKNPSSDGKKLKPVSEKLASSSFRTSAGKSDNNRLRRKLSLRPLEEVNEVSRTIVAGTRSWCGEFENSDLEETSTLESIVVLDSDDSGEEEGEEDNVSFRSRLSLAKRRRFG